MKVDIKDIKTSLPIMAEQWTPEMLEKLQEMAQFVQKQQENDVK